MHSRYLPVPRAFLRLAQLANDMASKSRPTWYALTWLAAARMIVEGQVPSLSTVDELSTESAWERIADAGLVIEWASPQTHDDESPRAINSARAAATTIVAELFQQLGRSPWDVLPILCDRHALKRLDPVIPSSLALINLTLDLAGPPVPGPLWLPDQSNGSTALAALRRGWTVLASPISGGMDGEINWLLAIETGRTTHERVLMTIERDHQGKPMTRAPVILATVRPLLQRDLSRLAEWDSSPALRLESFTRGEPWMLQELVNRATTRAIFNVDSRVLFSVGQEYRLRKYLLMRGGERNEIEALISLPPIVSADMASAESLIVLSPNGHHDFVRMTDLSEIDCPRESDPDLSGEYERLVTNTAFDLSRTTTVTREEIERKGSTFSPQQYLQTTIYPGPNSRCLKEICINVRMPAPTKDATGVPAYELGIQDLGTWSPIADFRKKIVHLRDGQNEIATLREGDIILSIKGTVGKVGLVGRISAKERVVVSPSCVALRIENSTTLLPEYLLMYLRSERGQAQLKSLQIGDAVPYIRSTTLLTSFRVPVPSEAKQMNVLSVYSRLTVTEMEISRLRGELNELAASQWAMNAIDDEDLPF